MNKSGHQLSAVQSIKFALWVGPSKDFMLLRFLCGKDFTTAVLANPHVNGRATSKDGLRSFDEVPIVIQVAPLLQSLDE